MEILGRLESIESSGFGHCVFGGRDSADCISKAVDVQLVFIVIAVGKEPSHFFQCIRIWEE